MPAGGNSRFRGYPARMSERQQLALLLQMTSQDMVSSGGNRTESSNSNARSATIQHRGTKNRWLNNKNGDSPINQRKEEYRTRQILGNSYEQNIKESSEVTASNFDETTSSVSVDSNNSIQHSSSSISSSSSLLETGNSELINDNHDRPHQDNNHHQQQQQQHHHYHHQNYHQQNSAENSSAVLQSTAEESGAPCEMRRTPPQNKVDRTATGQSGSSPRVTLRLNQVRGTRDDKKNSVSSRQSNNSNANNSNNSNNNNNNTNINTNTNNNVIGGTNQAQQMEVSKSSTSSSTTSTSTITTTSTIAGASSSTSSSGSGNNCNNNGGGGGNSNSAAIGQSSSAGSGNTSSLTTTTSTLASSDAGDIYEFKSSKEATPVRGASSSPNPNSDKDKDSGIVNGAGGNSNNGNNTKLSGQTQALNSSNSSNNNSGIATTTISVTTTTNVESLSSNSNAVGISSGLANTGINDIQVATNSPAAKRSFDAGDNADEQDEENRRKKRKETITSPATTSTGAECNAKENIVIKGVNSGRQSIGRAAGGNSEKSIKVDSSAITASSFVEQCVKLGKQGGGGTNAVTTSSGKINQSNVNSNINTNITSNIDRKSPSGTSASNINSNNNSNNGSSPKPTTNPVSNSKQNATPGSLADSDGDDERPKSSDSGSAPKVPPLKIVIPQSTTSEQELGGVRNGKSISTRGHQLPYVVPSSNSNDSNDKDQNQTPSGTTSPTEVTTVQTKNDDKKDFTGVIHNEERSTHHQRVLRSSHRSGNGGNGSASSKESTTNQSTNQNYSNSSPLPSNTSSATTSASSTNDRSNNSSPHQQQQQQQRHHSPTPETITNSDNTNKTTTITESSSTVNTSTKTSGNNNTEKPDKSDTNTKNNQKENNNNNDNSENSSSTTSTTSTSVTSSATTVELHPRKRKMKSNKEAQQAAAAAAAATAAANESNETANAGPEVHPHDQPITNCYQLFLNIRKQIERRRKGLFPVQPKPPQGFKDYLMNRCTYVLAGNANKEPNINLPVTLQGAMKDLYIDQEKERYRLRMQHVVEKEKLVLSVEQEILRVHGRAARALANQSLPFSVCTILKDEEVYNVITPEQEEKDRNARSRYNGRLFLSWLQDVDDKWEKIKEAMLLRHHNEAESLHAVQKMDWEWKLKEVGLCEFKAMPQIEDIHVPMVHVSDDFDLLPA